jgi:hypothetical protein
VFLRNIRVPWSLSMPLKTPAWHELKPFHLDRDADEIRRASPERLLHAFLLYCSVGERGWSEAVLLVECPLFSDMEGAEPRGSFGGASQPGTPLPSVWNGQVPGACK